MKIIKRRKTLVYKKEKRNDSQIIVINETRMNN